MFVKSEHSELFTCALVCCLLGGLGLSAFLACKVIQSVHYRSVLLNCAELSNGGCLGWSVMVFRFCEHSSRRWLDCVPVWSGCWRLSHCGIGQVEMDRSSMWETPYTGRYAVWVTRWPVILNNWSARLVGLWVTGNALYIIINLLKIIYI